MRYLFVAAVLLLAACSSGTTGTTLASDPLQAGSGGFTGPGVIGPCTMCGTGSGGTTGTSGTTGTTGTTGTR